MQGYKYQMHLHTALSRCGRITPEELATELYENGYQGAVITNHFFNGNTGVDRSLPWESFVDTYVEDYLACKKEAEKYDLDIIFGIEEVVKPGLEILCYGIEPSVLYDHPELAHTPLENWAKIMRENGVVLVQSHPYREAGYIPNPGPLPLQFLDGLEVCNTSISKEPNDKAMVLANEHPRLIKTAGGDSHWRERIATGGIITKERIKNGKDLTRVLKSRDYELILE